MRRPLNGISCCSGSGIITIVSLSLSDSRPTPSRSLHPIYPPQISRATALARLSRLSHFPPLEPESPPLLEPTGPPATRIVPVQYALRELPFRRFSSRRQLSARSAPQFA